MKKLQELINTQKELKAKTLDRELTNNSFYERSAKMFEPITNKIEKQADNIQTLKDILQQNNNVKQITLPPQGQIKNNNSFFNKHSEIDNEVFLKLGRRETPQIKLNKETGNLTLLKPNGDNIPIKNSEGLMQLLFQEEPDTNNIKKDDIDQYFKIYEELNEFPGTSKRINKIANEFEFKDQLDIINKSSKPKLKSGQGLTETFQIPNTIKEIKERIQVLMAAKQNGHTNVINELTALLDVLLIKKVITLQEYLNYIS